MTSNISGFEQIVDGSSLYINGIKITNDATTPNTLLDVGPGICRDQSNALDLNIGNYGGIYSGSAANVTTIINAAVVGINGIDTGTLAASTVYYVYVVADTTGTNPTGAMISINAPTTGPVMPYNYNAYRHVGYVITDSSSHFLKFYVAGVSNTRTLTFDAPQATSVTAGAATSFTAVSLTNFVPAIDALQVLLYTSFLPAAAGDTLSLSPYSANGSAVVVTGQVASVHVTTNSSVISKLNTTNPNIYYKVSSGTDAVAIDVAGFVYTL